MTLVLRLAVATMAGWLLALALAYFGLIITTFATVGVSLRAPARDPSPGEYAVLLTIAAVGAAVGAQLTARLARSDASLALLGLALGLAATYWWGFRGGSLAWPEWWAPTVALAAVLGVWAGTLGIRRQPA